MNCSDCKKSLKRSPSVECSVCGMGVCLGCLFDHSLEIKHKDILFKTCKNAASNTVAYCRDCGNTIYLAKHDGVSYYFCPACNGKKGWV